MRIVASAAVSTVALLSASGGPALTPSKIPEGTPAVACGLVNRVIKANSVSLRVPPPGHGVTSYKEYSDGRDAEFGLYTAENGEIHYALGPTAPASSGQVSALSSPSACSDDAYNATGQKDSAFTWYLGDGAMPSNIARETVRTVLINTGNSLENSVNDCGLSDQLSLAVNNAASAGYNSGPGDTDTESEIDNEDGESSCENYIFIDMYNTVDFGDLADHGDPPLALACTWWIPGRSTFTSQDIRFNVVDFDWTTAPAAPSCSGDYDLRSVAVHEFGHALGMGHVSEENHGWLTMSTQVGPCTNHQRSLGRGDVLGLRTKY